MTAKLGSWVSKALSVWLIVFDVRTKCGASHGRGSMLFSFADRLWFFDVDEIHAIHLFLLVVFGIG
ncbi:MAG: hypothetical protein CL862_07725 [Cyanobium sp. NAT70]|nr:hypothetical protein [Cyanobium sp. NAT70]|tara:strand:- start:456 stop:653 length:198 start_codon:yes stop_codon:yes gene_type:complete